MVRRFLFATAALVAIFGSKAAAAAPLRISYAAIASNTAGIWMVEGRGAFKRQGLDAQFVYISSSGTNVQALLAGSNDVMVGGSSGIISAATRGAPIVAIASQMNRPPTTPLTAKTIDNSIVDQLLEENFSQKLFGKELR